MTASPETTGIPRAARRGELLRLLMCGSVDDGKSTLIGRLLLDSMAVASDVLEALQRDSRRHGTTGGDLDPALLTDGLKAEREQGITIDVAYRYFSTAKRTFIVADVPGHEQYTRNMATGASTANLAVLLVDARKGVVEQTRRHAFISALFGIRHLIVTVNKMDLVEYDQNVFDGIEADFTDFAARLQVNDISFIPISALQGDNVVDPSSRMPWYRGPTVMHTLETVHIASDRNLIDLRFPVQYVNRQQSDYRGYCGTIASGVANKGDEVMVLPSRCMTRIRSIERCDGPLQEAFAPLAVSMTFEDEIDVSRGDMIVHPGNVPEVSGSFEAMIVWMAEEPFRPGKEYWLKQTTKMFPARLRALRYRVNVQTSHREEAKELCLNEIGRSLIVTGEPLAFDPYKRNRTTGSFILIDRVTNNTVGVGLILEQKTEAKRSGLPGVLRKLRALLQ